MIRLNMIVEGQTEEAFVNRVLVEHLSARNVFPSCRCVETSRDKRAHRIYRGGLLDYHKAKKDLHRWIKEDQHEEVFFTTMFDLYALPADFPAREESGRLSDPYAKVARLEEAFAEDINHPRFISYLQLHEYEALLLADPDKFDWEFLEHDDAIARLVELVAEFDSPELIDEGQDSAPSKRIIKEIPEYEDLKASAGPLIASKIGLTRLREACSHFNEWITRLETLDE